jgi:hypothetical protein
MVNQVSARPGDRAMLKIVWVHGGGRIAGSKDQIASYLKILDRHLTTV